MRPHREPAKCRGQQALLGPPTFPAWVSAMSLPWVPGSMAGTMPPASMLGTTTAPPGATSMAIAPARSCATGETRGLQRDARRGGAEGTPLGRLTPVLDRDVGGVLVLHALHVVASVDMVDFAR